MEPLLLEEIAPVVAKVIRLRLRGLPSADADDLKQNVLVKLLQWLRRPSSEKSQVQDFVGFAARTTHNECHNYLRERAPARLRLKNNLRNLLTKHTDFAIWKIQNQTLCGFAAWEGARQPPQPPPAFESDTELESRLGFLSREVTSTAQLAAEIFRHSGRPIELDELVDLVARLKGICLTSLEERLVNDVEKENSLFRIESRCDENIATGELLACVWEQVLKHPPRQRRAYFYTSADERGESLLIRLLSENVVTVNQMRAGLELSRAELIEVLEQLPMSVTAAAKEIGVPTYQVSNWRYRIKAVLRQCAKTSV